MLRFIFSALIGSVYIVGLVHVTGRRNITLCDSSDSDTCIVNTYNDYYTTDFTFANIYFGDSITNVQLYCDTNSCQGSTIYCPKGSNTTVNANIQCSITCYDRSTYSNVCDDMTIDATNSQYFNFTCIEPYGCWDMFIYGPKKDIQNSIARISCTANGCWDNNYYLSYTDNIYIHCGSGSDSYCSSTDGYSASCDLSSYYMQYSKNVNVYCGDRDCYWTEWYVNYVRYAQFVLDGDDTCHNGVDVYCNSITGDDDQYIEIDEDFICTNEYTTTSTPSGSSGGSNNNSSGIIKGCKNNIRLLSLFFLLFFIVSCF